MCHTFAHNLHAIQPNSSHHFIHPDSSRRSIRQDSIHHEFTTCQWYKHVPFALIPEFPSLFLISSFEDLRYQFSMFYPCMTLLHLWNLWILLSICPRFSLLLPLLEIESPLVDHDLLCLPLPDVCLPMFLRALQSR